MNDYERWDRAVESGAAAKRLRELIEGRNVQHESAAFAERLMDRIQKAAYQDAEGSWVLRLTPEMVNEALLDIGIDPITGRPIVAQP